MNNVVAEMLLTTPAPAAIWATLWILTLPAVLVLANPEAMRNPGEALRSLARFLRLPAGRGERKREAALEALAATQFAEEVRVAADRAALAAERWHERWEASTDEVTEAWQAWLDADARLRVRRAAAAFGTPWSAQTPTEYAARERFLHKAVRTAAGNGWLPAAAVADALAGRAGWDARLHPLDQELVVFRAAAGHLRDRYERAVAAEKTARHDATLARRTSDSLRQEAWIAAERATGLRRLVPARLSITAPASEPAVAAVWH
ncbi:hypothetical protein Aab01nite_72900 [Paractinoplanes abujensis]|uniref:Uncharacterized protein n=1 Tax=Paractinoplanes abujensis TaxID=882441 RepID=A0A7W7CX94_9ACTN|nr:hypothetical protein [Actinoplanes abujensis]MBB4694968.1 hypothetical protein [Actinoplanes abujensis]GID23700.1 hypothetical protein Aab01nite_72900 [Actinoplanes abujensis]